MKSIMKKWDIGNILEEMNKEELHEPKWVIDQEAWTETISEPVSG